jgi:hypothetical protein
MGYKEESGKHAGGQQTAPGGTRATPDKGGHNMNYSLIGKGGGGKIKLIINRKSNSERFPRQKK